MKSYLYPRSYPNVGHVHSYMCYKRHQKVETGKFIKELSVLTGIILVLLAWAVVLQG